MNLIFWLKVALFVVLLGLSAFFSSSETSLFSLDRFQLERLKRDSHPRAGLIERLLSRPRRLIVTILIGNEFVNIACSVISATIVIDLYGAQNKLFNLLIMVPILLLIGEITPKAMAMRANVAFASFQSRPIDLFAKTITPIRWVVHKLADLLATAVVGQERRQDHVVTEDLVRALAHEAVGEGVMDRTEAQYINKILDFGNKTVEDVMTRRTQMVLFRATDSVDEVIEALQRTRHTKVPVCRKESPDQIIGILHARDLLGVDLAAQADRKSWIRTLLRAPYFVPESKPAISLFHSFRKRRRSIALVVDEYGGVTGLVTMEDLLECIFGDIRSPSEVAKEAAFELLSDGQARVEGSMWIERFNSLFNADLTVDFAETLGGLILHVHGELPVVGTSIHIDHWKLTVLSMAGNRIEHVLVDTSRDQPVVGTEIEDTPGPSSGIVDLDWEEESR